jgi:hypothetical protein
MDRIAPLRHALKRRWACHECLPKPAVREALGSQALQPPAIGVRDAVDYAKACDIRSAVSRIRIARMWHLHCVERGDLKV